MNPPLSKVSSTTTIQPKKRKKNNKNENRILKIELGRTKCEQDRSAGIEKMGVCLKTRRERERERDEAI